MHEYCGGRALNVVRPCGSEGGRKEGLKAIVQRRSVEAQNLLTRMRAYALSSYALTRAALSLADESICLSHEAARSQCWNNIMRCHA